MNNYNMKTGTFVCKICNKSFAKLHSLQTHISQIHHITYLEYSVKYENFIIPKCSVCDNRNKVYTGHGTKFLVTCGNHDCLKKLRKINSFNYIQSKLRNKTAFERRHDGEMSTLEAWFYDDVMVKHKLLEKYDIVNEFPESPYFIDFAFTNIKFAVELDGSHHFNKDGSYKQKDIERHQYLINSGWKVYRIAYWERSENKIQEFLSILHNIKGYDKKLLDTKLHKYIKPQNCVSCKDREKKQLVLSILDQIDFKHPGWATKISQLCKIKQPRMWIEKNMPELLLGAWTATKRKHHTKIGKSINRNRTKAEFTQKYKETYNKLYKQRIQKIVDNIDTTKIGWQKEAKKLLGMRCNKFLKERAPDLFKKCWHPLNKRTMLNQYKSTDISDIDFTQKGWKGKLLNQFNMSHDVDAFRFANDWLMLNHPEIYTTAYQRISKKHVDKLKLIQNCDIDFSKRGWVHEVSVLTGMRYRYVYNFMRRHFPMIMKNAWTQR